MKRKKTHSDNHKNSKIEQPVRERVDVLGIVGKVILKPSFHRNGLRSRWFECIPSNKAVVPGLRIIIKISKWWRNRRNQYWADRCKKIMKSMKSCVEAYVGAIKRGMMTMGWFRSLFGIWYKKQIFSDLLSWFAETSKLTDASNWFGD